MAPMGKPLQALHLLTTKDLKRHVVQHKREPLAITNRHLVEGNLPLQGPDLGWLGPLVAVIGLAGFLQIKWIKGMKGKASTSRLTTPHA